MAHDLLIGWAQRDITPDQPVNLCGQFGPRITKTVRDPVTATALVLASGKTAEDYAVFVSCDTGGISPGVQDQCRQAIHRRIPSLDVTKLIMNATHTHTAPQIFDFWYPPQGPEVMTPKAYAEFATQRVADAVAEAWKNKKPGGVSWDFGYAVVGHNRRVVYSDDLSKRPNATPFPGGCTNGTAAMYGNTNDAQFSHMEGYVDHSLNVLFTWDRKQRLTGLIVNLACPSQETETESAISADFWHDIRVELRARHGQNLFVLPQCSAAGDLSPHPLLHKKAEEHMLKLAGRSRREEIGRRVTQVVDDILPAAAQDIVTQPLFRHIVKTLHLPRRLITVAEYKAIRADLERMQTDVAQKTPALNSQIGRCRSAIDRYRKQSSAPLSTEELHLIRLGDIVFATVRFELFLDYGLRIKARSPALQTFIVQLTAGDFSMGTYLPTARAIADGGYSTGVFDNEIGPEGGHVLVEEIVTGINNLFDRSYALLTTTATGLLPVPKNLRNVRPPTGAMTWRPVPQQGALQDVRSFHNNKEHGLLYLRGTFKMACAGKGTLSFGSDGPIKVWFNGNAVACEPKATNPCIANQYKAPVKVRKGNNEVLFALVTNNGKAWGIKAELVIPPVF